MKPHAICRPLTTGALLALCTAMSAAAASIDEAEITAPRGAWATQGSGIARMVIESVQIRTASAAPGDAILELVDVALDRVPVTVGLDPFSGSASPSASNGLLLAATSEHIFAAPGTSSVSVAETKSPGSWNLLPAGSKRFLQVSIGMMALGFVPATLSRVR